MSNRTGLALVEATCFTWTYKFANLDEMLVKDGKRDKKKEMQRKRESKREIVNERKRELARAAHSL